MKWRRYVGRGDDLLPGRGVRIQVVTPHHEVEVHLTRHGYTFRRWRHPDVAPGDWEFRIKQPAAWIPKQLRVADD